jgi:hypothetical protein
MDSTEEVYGLSNRPLLAHFTCLLNDSSSSVRQRFPVVIGGAATFLPISLDFQIYAATFVLRFFLSSWFVRGTYREDSSRSSFDEWPFAILFFLLFSSSSLNVVSVPRSLLSIPYVWTKIACFRVRGSNGAGTQI